MRNRSSRANCDVEASKSWNSAMAKSRDPFFTALVSIRKAAESGDYAAGEPIVIVEEARRLRLSTTPVREALAWLCGEGLIERGPSGGFLARRLDAAAVRDLYAFRLVCLKAGLDLSAPLPANERSRSFGRGLSSLQGLFDRLVRQSGNAVLIAAHGQVTRQLRLFQDVEARLFRDLEEEAQALLTLARRDDDGAFRAALSDYHDRRTCAAVLLALEAGRSGESRPPDPFLFNQKLGSVE